MKQDVTFWLSIASFATSGILAIIKLVEFFGANKIRIKADVSLTSLPELGNTITLLNDSEIPITISYFELVWTNKRKLFGLIPLPFTRKVEASDSPIDPPDGYSALVAPHETHVLQFTEQYHFDWGVELEHDIYLKVWIVGHDDPFWLWVMGRKKRGAGLFC
jgi:hypothetical protein